MPQGRLSARILVWLTVLGTAIRVFYFVEHTESAFFGVPLLDEKYYVTVAWEMLTGGDVAAINPGFRPFLYPFLLLLGLLAASGEGLALVIVLQHALGILTGLMVAVLAARLSRRADAGAIAGVIYLLAAPPLFFEGELLIATLVTVLTAVWLAAFDGRPSLLAWLLAGGWIAFAAQARPNAILVLGAFLIVAVTGLGLPEISRRRRGALLVAAWGGALLVLAAFGLLQYSLIGRFQLMGGSGGVNLYLGNKAGADGMIPRQDRDVTYGAEYRDSVQIFAEEVYREEHDLDAEAQISPEEISRYWTLRTFEEIADDPARWLALMARKMLYLLSNREIPNNKNFDFIRTYESPLLRYLPVSWWLLCALAPLGAWMVWRGGDRRRLLWTTLFVLIYGAGIVLFFVNSRFRIPLWPPLAALAGVGAATLFDAFRARHWREAGRGVALCALCGGVSLASALAVPEQSFARDFFFRSVALLEKGRFEEALDSARRSVELDDTQAAAVFQLGTAALVLEDYELALETFRRAMQLKPEEPRTFNNLGIAFDGLGRPAESYRAYLQAIRIEPTFPPPWVNAALIELRLGWPDQAEKRLTRAAQLGDRSVQMLCAQAFLARERGHAAESAEFLEQARKIDPIAVAHLVEENARKLSPPDLGFVAVAVKSGE